jgi:hypothetical protein
LSQYSIFRLRKFPGGGKAAFHTLVSKMNAEFDDDFLERNVVLFPDLLSRKTARLSSDSMFPAFKRPFALVVVDL